MLFVIILFLLIVFTFSYFIWWLIYRKAFKSQKKVSKILVFIGGSGLIISFVLNNCAIPYPASIRAFIPRFLDSQYQDFKQFAQKEIGRVLYARPVSPQTIQHYKNTDDLERSLNNGQCREFKINNIMVEICFVFGGFDADAEYKYIYIADIGYYRGWKQWQFNLFVLPSTLERIYIYI
ncbi:hypothetical protein CQA53_11235 [Helicobacter didelphidarum]|uniref:Uncharacterized protein n=1 Tax=Helicobacter didelphidarum TaxID=2040648 RepID=A0A3D8I5F6_9HELI|nr:hypothetical protein [Helicobacter didelphidarum]RDU59791.1 hypothetical protein CQA53_11235 [Helicobacter didelphidarum]